MSSLNVNPPRWVKFVKDCCEGKDYTYEDMIGPSQQMGISKQRRDIYVLVREELKLTFPQIAKLFNRKHSGVVLAYHKAIEEAKKQARRDKLKELQGLPPVIVGNKEQTK